MHGHASRVETEIEDFDDECYRLEFDFVSVDARARVSLWYTVGDDSQERLEVVFKLDDLSPRTGTTAAADA